MINLHEPLIEGNEWKYIKKCLDRGWVSSVGHYVNSFEKKIAKYTGAKYAIACINGTSALQISLKIVGIKKNEEVIIPSLTFIAPVNAISYNEARPVFMDNDENYTIDVQKTIDFINNETKSLKRKIGKKTFIVTVNKKTGNRVAALVVVHVFGNAVKLDKLTELCKKKNINIIEDAAESLGTFFWHGKFKKRHTGTVGKIGCLSFNGNKVITTGGGGMILTNDLTIAKRAKYFTTQAKDESIFSVHNEIGYNFRLSNIQAALGLAQLESLPKLLKKKNLIHQQYKKKIKKIKGLNISKTPNHAKSNNWLNILEIEKKMTKSKLLKVIKFLLKKGIESRPLWKPCHLQNKYKNFQTYRLKTINKIYNSRLCLPSSAQLNIKQQNFICSKLKNIF